MSIFPFFENNKRVEEKLPRFCEFAFDFSTNQFLLRDGREYLVYDNEALKIWIHKALITEYRKYLVYDHNYGSDLHRLIGSSFGEIEILRLEVEQYIKEALLVNPYIISIENFSIFEDIEKKVISCTVNTVYGGYQYMDELVVGG